MQELKYDVEIKQTREKENAWKLLPKSDPLPTIRSKHTCVVYNNALYIFGGSQKIDAFSDLWKFDLETSHWSEIKPKEKIPEMYFHSAEVYQDAFYVFGGYTDKNLNDTFVFDFKTLSWKKLETTGSVPKARSGHISVLYKNSIYVFGGFDGSNRLNDLYALDLDTKEWREVKTKGEVPSPRMNLCAAIEGDFLYVFAGHSGSSSTNDFFKYSFETGTWSRIENTGAPERRFGHSMVSYQGSLYVFAGNSKDVMDNRLYKYHIESGTWTIVSSAGDIPTGRCYTSMVVKDNYFYVFGGTMFDGTNKTFCNDLFKYTCPTAYPASTLTQDLHQLYKEGLLSDVLIKTKDGGSFPCHKAILASRSGYFSLQFMSAEATKLKQRKNEPVTVTFLFCSHCQKGPLVVELTEPSAVMSKLLDFIYTGEIDFTGVSEDTILRLVVASQTYETERLGICCQNHVCTNLNLKNVIPTLKWSVTEKCKLVESFCFYFILKNYNSVLALEEVTSLPPQLLVSLMRMQQQTEMEPPLLADVPPSSLVEDLNALYSEMDYADFSCEVGDEVIQAHTCILAARSEYFRALFRSGMKENESQQISITVGEMVPTPSAFKAFLEYLYCDTVNMAVEDSVYLLPFSDFYRLTTPKLRFHCITNIEQNIAPKNLLQAYEAADAIGSPDLKKTFLHEIVTKYLEVMEFNYIEHLDKKLLLEILRGLADHQRQK